MSDSSKDSSRVQTSGGVLPEPVAFGPPVQHILSSMRFCTHLLAVLSLVFLLNLSGFPHGSFCKAAMPDDRATQQDESSQITDPMYIKFLNVEHGSFVKVQGVVGSIQASHSSYSRNTFFLKVWRALDPTTLRTDITCSREAA